MPDWKIKITHRNWVDIDNVTTEYTSYGTNSKEAIIEKLKEFETTHNPSDIIKVEVTEREPLC